MVNRIPVEAYYFAAGLIGLALIRPVNGPIAAPIIIQRDHNRAGHEELPRSNPRATVPATSDTEQERFHAGDAAAAQEARVERVARGLTVVHEAYFEAGDRFPELVGYEAGAVWVREPAR